MTRPFSRRTLVSAGGIAAVAAAVGGCSDNSPTSQTSGRAPGALVWWDHFLPKAALEKKTFAQFHTDGGPEVQYTVYNPNDMGKAVQLAFQSKQMPDVFTLAGLQTAAVTLKQGNWFAPISNPEAITKNLPEGSVVEGQNSFDGKLYSFPLSTFRGWDMIPWANSELLGKADLEQASGPQSWDALKATIKTAQEKSGKPGILMPLGFPARMGAFVDQLAQAAGFPGSGGVDWTSGAYHYDHDAYVNAMEWLRSFQTDKLLLPASSTLDARAGRVRWAAGDAVFFLDGSYNVGVVKTDLAKFLPNMAASLIPTPNGEAPVVSGAPGGGDMWISASSKQVEAASALLALFTSKQFRIGQAEAMDAGPIDLDLVPASKAHPQFKKVCAWFAKYGKRGPSPITRNPLIAEVNAVIKPVKPDLGTIVQGVFSGDVTDVRGTLKKLSDASESARELAIKAKGAGKVSQADWMFADWKRGTDYTG